MSDRDELNEILEGADDPDVYENEPHSLARIVADDCERKISNQVGNVQWISKNDKIFIPTGKTVGKIIPGMYSIDISNDYGVFFERIQTKTQGLLRFPDTNSESVIIEIQKFWEKKEDFRRNNLPFKRGILLFGPPGSGKSSTLQLIVEDVVKRGGICVIFDNPHRFKLGMRVLREIQSDTPVIVLMEDIDSILEDEDESEVLQVLDGIEEVETCVFLATTNYPERLGARIVNRPSRFDKAFKIGHPNKESRRMYFEFLLKNNEDLKIDIDKWVDDTEGFSVSHLKELFVAVTILGDKYEDAINNLSRMKENPSSQDKKKLGFS